MSDVFRKYREDAEGEVRVVFVDDTEIVRLNKQFFGRSTPTDVIAFDLSENDAPLEGEIYVSVDTALRQAREYGVSFWNELCRLAVHGALHLVGFDDTTDAERQKMHELEDEFLRLEWGAEKENV